LPAGLLNVRQFVRYEMRHAADHILPLWPESDQESGLVGQAATECRIADEKIGGRKYRIGVELLEPYERLPHRRFVTDELRGEVRQRPLGGRLPADRLAIVAADTPFLALSAFNPGVARAKYSSSRASCGFAPAWIRSSALRKFRMSS